MPIKKEKYPPNWKEISKQVRAEAGYLCEWCGAPNSKYIRRIPATHHQIVDVNGQQKRVPVGDFEILFSAVPNFRPPTDWGLTKIVLTVAHLDRNPGNNERSNLAALCQRCHLGHDREANIRTRRFGAMPDETLFNFHQ